VSQTGKEQAVVQPAPGKEQAVVQPSPVGAPSLQEKLVKLVRGTAKAAAILGVAVALVSVCVHKPSLSKTIEINVLSYH
jgi:hypothetical protein